MKFEAKVAAGFQPKELVKEEANNVKATRIVMDRSLFPFPLMFIIDKLVSPHKYLQFCFSVSYIMNINFILPNSLVSWCLLHLILHHFTSISQHINLFFAKSESFLQPFLMLD